MTEPLYLISYPNKLTMPSFVRGEAEARAVTRHLMRLRGERHSALPRKTPDATYMFSQGNLNIWTAHRVETVGNIPTHKAQEGELIVLQSPPSLRHLSPVMTLATVGLENSPGGLRGLLRRMGLDQLRTLAPPPGLPCTRMIEAPRPLGSQAFTAMGDDGHEVCGSITLLPVAKYGLFRGVRGVNVPTVADGANPPAFDYRQMVHGLIHTAPPLAAA